VPDDPDKPLASLVVTNGDAELLRTALEEEGFVVGEASEQPAASFAGVLLWLIKVVIEGGAWDLAKFVASRGAKGMKKLVKHLQQKSGKPGEKGVVVLEDSMKTSVSLPSDLPEAAYADLAKLKLSEYAGKTLSWHDPPGEWQVDEPPKIKGGDNSF
jgi:hypothetical protein